MIALTISSACGSSPIVVAGQLGKPIQTFTGPQMQDILNIKKSLGFVDPRYNMKECELCDTGDWRPGATCAFNPASARSAFDDCIA